MHFAFLLRSKGHISINISLHHLSQIQFTKLRSLYEVYSLFGWLVPIASSGGIDSGNRYFLEHLFCVRVNQVL